MPYRSLQLERDGAMAAGSLEAAIAHEDTDEDTP